MAGSSNNKVSLPVDVNGYAVPALTPTGSGQVTIGVASNRQSLPTLTQVVRLTPTQPCYVNFGDGTVTAVADGSNFLLIAGDYFRVPFGTTHVSCIRATTEDGVLSFSRME